MATQQNGEDPVWAAYDLAELERARAQSGRPWIEFLEVSTLSVGLYVLPKEGLDRQQPHDRDEVYHVISGSAVVNVDGEERDVGPGSVIYVRARAAHHFHSINEELRVLVFFSAAEPS